jgi:YcaO-like protein with predicted kinase domain
LLDGHCLAAGAIQAMRSTFLEQMIDLGGTLRTRKASWTLERAKGVLGRVGITRVANVTGLDDVGMPTWMVVRPLARSLTVSQGKGLDHSLAQISGIMESVEIHHAEHFVPAGTEAALWASVRDDTYVNPLLLPIRSDAVFNENTVCHWIPGMDILSGRLRWIPRELIELDFTTKSKEVVFVSSSNGLASGNTKDEAILHGLCEVIERDQAAFWLVRQRCSKNLPSTRVDLETIDDADCRWLIDLAVKAGLDLVVWYATTNGRRAVAVTLIGASRCRAPSRRLYKAGSLIYLGFATMFIGQATGMISARTNQARSGGSVRSSRSRSA